MAARQVVGSVAALWRFPIKSMRGERVDQAELTPHGALGDRAYALLDVETGKVASAKSVKRFPQLLGCRAGFVESPQIGRGLPPVRVTLPGGTSVTSDASDADRVLSGFFGREVTLTRVAPADFTIDQYHPDVEGADPAGHRNTTVDQKLGSALFDLMGAPSPVPVGAFFDVFPVSLLTSSTVARLAKLRPESRFDPRRFRMNVIVDTPDAGFVENGWIGRELVVGQVVRLGVTMPDPRCVMTTLEQEELPGDMNILRTLVQHNRLDIGGGAMYPCAGVYAVVGAPGTIRIDDLVAFA